MQKLYEIIQKQKIGARFVVSAPMLGIDVAAFDQLAQTWQHEGGEGFEMHGIPFRKVIDGQFFIQRVTLVRIES